MQSTCEQCGCQFIPLGGSKGKFCSHACHRQWQRENGNQTRICPTCDKPFITYKDPANARTYCSPECRPAKVEKIAKTCEGCGKEFMVWPSTQSQRYCTRKCRQEHKCTITPCPNCGKDVRSWQGNKSTYCNRACEKAHTVAETNCPVCNKRFSYHKSWPRIHCSRKCSNSINATKNLGNYALSGPDNPTFIDGGDSYRGPNWHQQRKKARQRDGYKCQCCGVSERKLRSKLHVHHIRPFRTFGYIVGENTNYIAANETSNLVSLCPVCHVRAERGLITFQLPLI